MINLFTMAIVSMFILVIMGIISNTNTKAFKEIENQIYLMNCPYPINGGTATNINGNASDIGMTITYDLVRDNTTSGYRVTLFSCSIDGAGLRQVNITVLSTTNNWFGVGEQYLSYLMNYFFTFSTQIQAVLTLFAFIITPANFSILGNTLDDLSGIAVATIVMLYLFSYTMIVAWLYVTFNPFKGG